MSSAIVFASWVLLFFNGYKKDSENLNPSVFQNLHLDFFFLGNTKVGNSIRLEGIGASQTWDRKALEESYFSGLTPFFK